MLRKDQGERLRQIMVERGMGPKELGERVGVRRQAIHTYLNGKDPPANRLEAMAVALKVHRLAFYEKPGLPIEGPREKEPEAPPPPPPEAQPIAIAERIEKARESLRLLEQQLALASSAKTKRERPCCAAPAASVSAPMKQPAVDFEFDRVIYGANEPGMSAVLPFIDLILATRPLQIGIRP